MPDPIMWIMLVGIDFYSDKAIQLRGAANDVSDVEESLTYFHQRDMGVNVIKLVASVTDDPSQEFPPEPESLWPTYENFTATLKHITLEASPDDIVYIHYSGHGSLHLTANSKYNFQEEYGTDAALVLYEPKSQFKVRYLRGIELALLLDNMVNKRLRLTVVLDSCCSGSISRSKDHLVRGVPWSVDVDSEFPLQAPTSCELLASKKGIFRNAATTCHWLLNPKRYALLAACGPHELAKEILVGKKRYNGALSYHILKTLDFCVQKRIQGVTHKQIYQHIRAEMYLKFTEQHPILIGAERTTFLGRGVSSRETSLVYDSIIKISADQEIWLNVGLIHGVCMGDEYVVKSHAESTEVLARITVTAIHAVHSITKLATTTSLNENGLQVKVGYCAVLAALGQPRAHIKVFPEAESAWEEMLAKSMWLQQFPRNELAPIDIPCFSVVKTDIHQYTVLDSIDCPIPNLPSIASSDSRAGNEIITILEHLSRYYFVKSLDNRRANNLLDSNFLITVNTGIDLPNALGSDDSIAVPHDSKMQITFENLTDEALYFAVLDLTPLWAVKNLCFQHREYQTVLPKAPCRDVNPPNIVKFTLRMTVPARLRVQQAGCISVEDVLKFIVSTSAVLGTEAMELPSLWDKMEQTAPAAASGDEAFGLRTRKSLVGEDEGIGRMRGETTAVRWACQSVKIRTVLNVAPGAGTVGESSPATPSG